MFNLTASEICDKITAMIRAEKGLDVDIDIISTSAYKSIKFLGLHTLRVKCGRKNYIYLKNSYEHLWDKNKTIKIEKIKSDELWSRISFGSEEELISLYPLILKLYEEAFLLVNVELFSCCSRYIQCSDEQMCVQPNKRLSIGCQYRKHITNGRIFYGKNRNVSRKIKLNRYG